MFRFSIRELMLVTLVVALVMGWALDHFNVSASRDKLARQSEGRGDFLRRLNIEITPNEFCDPGEFYSVSGGDVSSLPDSPTKRGFERAIKHYLQSEFASADKQPATSSSSDSSP
jgi:hypothetical protein